MTFNDIDSDALEAVALNCQANGIPRSSYLLDNTNLLDGDLKGRFRKSSRVSRIILE